jgi:hypothetical protein
MNNFNEMKLNELKKPWDQLTVKKELDEDQIREILRHRTGNVIERIERNVRIGFILLFILIVCFILDDYVYSPRLLSSMDAEIIIPGWLSFLSLFSNVFIVVTFIYFVIKYYRVKKSCDISCNLRETLVKIIGILHIYKRLFYLALVIFTFSLTMAFLYGMYTGITIGVEREGILFSDLPAGKWILSGVIGLAILTIFVGGIYLLMRWGFRRLYGNYLIQLRQTFQELNEIEN